MRKTKEQRTIRVWTKRSGIVLSLVAALLFVFFAEIPASYAVVSDATFFSYLNLDYPGMSAVKSAVNAGDYTLAKSELLKYYQTRTSRNFYDLPTTGDKNMADQSVVHKFKDPFGGDNAYYDCGTPIQWTGANADKTDIHYFWQITNLGAVYVNNRDEKYAQEWIYEMTSFVDSPGATYLGLPGAGIRMQKMLQTYQYFIPLYKSPSFNGDNHIKILKSLKEHADYLYVSDTTDNKGAYGKVGLFEFTIMFPEFKNTNIWQNNAVAGLETHITADIYADGVGKEQSPEYMVLGGNGAAYGYEDGYAEAKKLASLNGLNPFSSTFNSRVEKALEFHMFLAKPNLWLPAIGDTENLADDSNIINSGAIALNRQDMKYVATSGVSGTIPTQISRDFPVGGISIMRSNWGTASNFNQQLYLSMLVGPYGGWHDHYDWLSFEAYAYGKDLVVDAGIFDYDTWHEYAKKIQSHNTITVDNSNPADSSTYATKEWITNNGFDFVDGWVKSSVTHDRKIFFVRNEYWIISDLLTGSGSHTYDQYWHLPAISWTTVPTLDATSKKVTSTGNGLIIMPADPTSITASIMNDYVNNEFTRSKTVKYTKSGNVPVSFDTVLYPYPGTAPVITLTRLSVKRGTTNLVSTTASGLKIDIGTNEDYYFIAHDGSTAQTDYGLFQFNGDVAYLRKNSAGVITNIQIKDGTELKESGINLATTYGVKAHISSSNNVVEINAPTPTSPVVTNFNIWGPNTVSVKINGVSVGFTQNGNYVVPGTGADTTPPVRSNGQPTGTITSSTAILSLNTNEPATCKYSTTAGTAYDLMASSATVSGTLHSWPLSGLSDGPKTYYVRCKDSAGNTNADDYSILFTVGVTNPNTECTLFVAKTGNDANPGTEVLPWLTIQKAANMAVAGDVVCVKAGTYVEQVTFPNSGTSGNYITFQNYSSDIVTVKAPIKAYYGDPHKGNFQIFGTGFIKIKGFRFTTVGGAARTDSCGGEKCSPDGQISVEQGGHDVIIDGNIFNDIDGSAVIAGYTKVGGNKYAASDITFINNYVYRPTNWEWVELMSFDSVNRPNISHNTFAYQGFGECLDYKSGTDNGVISYNRVDNCWHPTMGPGGTPLKWGAIYIDAYDEGVNNNKVFNNIVSNAGGVTVGSEQGALAQNNIFYNNIVYDSTLGFGTGYCCSPYTPNEQNNLFINNVAYNIEEMAYFGEKGTNNIFRNNIADGSGSINIKSQNIQDHNSWNLGITDPKFVNAAAGDFYLQAGSSAIDAGTSVGAQNFDFDGNSRPIGAGYDLGAYEYCTGSSCSLPDPTPTCTDGIQNQDETGTDCGGSVCPACLINLVSTCQTLYANAQYILTADPPAVQGTCFTIAGNNITLDGQGYTVNYAQSVDGFGVNNSGGYDNITIKNVNFVQENPSVIHATAIIFYGAKYGNITNNTMAVSGGSDTALGAGDGVGLYNSSKFNSVSNNKIRVSGGNSDGIWIHSSNSNTFSNNYIIASGSLPKIGIAGVNIYNSSGNSITGGSVISQNTYDYMLTAAGATNTFRNTNFTVMRRIYFNGANLWFNYNNEKNGNIWLKTKTSALTSINRTIVSANSVKYVWNDSSENEVTVAYAMTGLAPNTKYYIYKNVDGIMTVPYNLITSRTGELPAFTISLSGNMEIIVTLEDMNFVCEDSQLDIVFVLDASGSMRDDCGSTDKITCLKDAAKHILDSPKLSNSRVGIFAFAEHVNKIVDLTNVPGNESLLKNRINSITLSSGTRVGDALRDALIYLNTTDAPGRKKIIILFTDGIVNTGDLGTTGEIEKYISNNWKDGPIKVFTVGTGDELDAPMLHMLNQVAKETYGKFYREDTNCDGACISKDFLSVIESACEHETSGLVITFYPLSSDNLIVPLGGTGQAVINVKNLRSRRDIVEVSVLGLPPKINNWVWIDGHRYDDKRHKVYLNMEPRETKSVAVNVFGGEITSDAKLRASAKAMSSGLSNETSKGVSIIYSEDGIDVKTPEYGLIGILAIAIIGAFLLV